MAVFCYRDDRSMKQNVKRVTISVIQAVSGRLIKCSPSNMLQNGAFIDLFINDQVCLFYYYQSQIKKAKHGSAELYEPPFRQDLFVPRLTDRCGK